MNDTTSCLEVRRALMSDPTSASAALLLHTERCAPCKSFMREVRAADTTIRKALSVEVPEGLGAKIRLRRSMDEARSDALDDDIAAAMKVAVPAGLKARIMAHNALNTATARKRGVVMQFALAACVAIAVATGSILFLAQSWSGPNSTLLDAVVAHSQHHISSHAQPIGDELVRPALHLVGLEFSSRPQGTITAATACDVREQRSLHLVMRGNHGPVNVYVMPGQSSERTMESSQPTWRGLVMPVRYGSLAVVGHPRENLDQYATSVRNSLRWRM